MKTNVNGKIISHRIKMRRYLAPAMVILLGAVISFSVFTLVSRLDRLVIRNEFQERANDRFDTINKEIESNLHAVVSLKAFIDSIGDVDRSEFREFVLPLLPLSPSLQAIEWIPHVPRSERMAYEAAAAKSGLSGFQITERDRAGEIIRAGERDEYFPVYLVEPLKGNEIALGFDLASNDIRKDALEKSRDSGEMVATGRIKLVQETAGQFGFLVFAPVYRKGVSADSIEVRRKNLKGFALGVFRIGDIVEKSLTHLKPAGIDIYIYDKSAATREESFLYFHPSRVRETPLSSMPNLEANPDDRLENIRTLGIANREWLVILKSTTDFVSKRETWHPLGVLTTGLLLTLFLASYIIRRRGRAEDRLRESEELYRITFELSGVGMAHLTTDGRWLRVNPKLCEITGYSREELLRKDFQEITHPDDIDYDLALVRQALTGEIGMYSTEKRFIKKDGSIAWINSTVALRREEDGLPKSFVITCEDITMRKMNQEALRESEERFRLAMQGANDGLWDRDLETDKVYYSPRWKSMLGCHEDELEGNLETWESLIHPDDLEPTQAKVRDFLEGRTDKFEAEFRMHHKDGHYVDILSRAFLFRRSEDDAGRMIGTHMDITERKRWEKAIRESESRYREFADMLPQPVLELDENLNVMFANQATFSASGYEQEVNRGEFNALQFLVPEDRDRAREDAQKFLSGVNSEYLEYTVLRKDGTTFPVGVYFGAIRQADKPAGLRLIAVDLTERKLAEEKVRQNELRFRALFETVTVGADELDLEGRFVTVNEQMCRITGYDESELVGMAASDLSPPDERGFERERLTEYLRGNTDTYNVEKRYIRKDGETIWVHVTCRKVLDSNGKPVCSAGIIMDVTERKAAEAALQESETKFRSYIENSPIAVLVADREGRIVDFNRSATNLLGCDSGTLAGMSLEKIHPEEDQDIFLQDFASLLEKGHVEMERRLMRADGQIRWVAINAVMLSDQTSLYYCLDITERKRAEEELEKARQELEMRVSERTIELAKTNEALRAAVSKAEDERSKTESIIAALGDSLTIQDSGHKILYQNLLSKEMVGDQEGQYCYAVFHQRDEVCRDCPLDLCFADGQIHTYESLITPDGKDQAYYYEITASPLRDAEGRIIAGIELARDITERKQSEKLREAKRIAEEANRAKSQFVANMSHEIRTPMNAIVGLSHLALETNPSPKLQDYLSNIQMASHALLKIINDILDFSKIEAGKLEIESIDFDLNAVLENVRTIAAMRAEEKGIEIFMRMAIDVPMNLIGDPLRLSQVLCNLTNNSVKFTEKGEIVISVNVEEFSQDVDRVVLRFAVKDTGIGISKEQMSRLLQPFSQADGSTTRRYGGSGLGLAISKRLVEMMGGQMEIESTLGEGSTFAFTASFGLTGAPIPLAVSRGITRVLKVLVVDDSATFRGIIEEFLRAMSFEVTLVDSGAAALSQLSESAERGDHPYDLVILDWKMPGMDGIETARCIVNDLNLPVVPIIFMLTGYGQQQAMHEARELPVSVFLTKPMTLSELYDAIIRVFSQNGKPAILKPISEEHRQKRGDALQGVRVLIAEDNEINQRIASEILKDAGAVVTLASNGKAAIEKLSYDTFDAVLMDLQMPEMDGIEATLLIRTKLHLTEVPIIALTAHAFEQERQRCLDSGMNDHVSKPFDPEQLISALLRWTRPKGGRDLDDDLSDQPAQKTENEYPLVSEMKVEAALRRVGGNRDLLIDLLRDFHRGFADVCGGIRTSMASGGLLNARQAVHTLKGASGNLSLEKTFGLAAALETAILSDDQTLCSSLLEELERTLKLTIGEIAILESEHPRSFRSEEVLQPLGPVKLSAHLEQMDSLLKVNNIKARITFGIIKGELLRLGFVEQLGIMESLMNKLDFKGARKILASIVESMGIKGENK